MSLVHHLIEVNKIACGNVDRRTLTTFPQALLLLRLFFPKIGHLYLGEIRAFLLCLDTQLHQIFTIYFKYSPINMICIPLLPGNTLEEQILRGEIPFHRL